MTTLTYSVFCEKSLWSIYYTQICFELVIILYNELHLICLSSIEDHGDILKTNHFGYWVLCSACWLLGSRSQCLHWSLYREARCVVVILQLIVSAVQTSIKISPLLVLHSIRPFEAPKIWRKEESGWRQHPIRYLFLWCYYIFISEVLLMHWSEALLRPTDVKHSDVWCNNLKSCSNACNFDMKFPSDVKTLML